MAMAVADVVILGGGVIGCSVAYHLGEQGISDVVVVERGTLGGGATGICPGGIRQQFEGEADCLLARRSVRFYERINEILHPDHPFLFERSGYLFTADSPELLARYQRNVEMQNRLGIPSRILEPREIEQLLPRVLSSGIVGASFCSEDGFIEDCHGVTSALAACARARGASIRYAEATSIARSAGIWRVTTDQGVFEAPHIVLAAGVDSVPLARTAGLELPIRKARRRLAFTAPALAGTLPPLLVAAERGFAGKQLSSGVFYLGWLHEDSETDDLTFLEEALRAGSTLIPLLAELPVRRVLAGVYDMSPDRRPVLGPVPGYDGLHLAVGFSGHGFMIAPAVGELVAAAIGGLDIPLVGEAFSLARLSHEARSEGLVI
jgi:sarcosine oxidase, subunit beta